MNKYWIPHQDIHKKVITAELQYYLGPDATVRPFTKDVRPASLSQSRPPAVQFAHWGVVFFLARQGEDGYLITTPGPCLSDVSLVIPDLNDAPVAGEKPP